MATSSRTADIGQRLLQIKQVLESKKEIRSQLTGELKSLKKQLASDFKVETLEAAQKLLTKMAMEIEEAENDIQEGLEKIEHLMEEEDEE
jgi:hypothetical protein